MSIGVINRVGLPSKVCHQGLFLGHWKIPSTLQGQGEYFTHDVWIDLLLFGGGSNLMKVESAGTSQGFLSLLHGVENKENHEYFMAPRESWREISPPVILITQPEREIPFGRSCRTSERPGSPHDAEQKGKGGGHSVALTLAVIIGPAGLDCGRRNHGQALLRTAVDLLLHPSVVLSSGLVSFRLVCRRILHCRHALGSPQKWEIMGS